MPDVRVTEYPVFLFLRVALVEAQPKLGAMLSYARPLILATVAMLLTAPATAQSTKNVCRDAHPLRAMTYNIRLDIASDGDNRWDNRRALVAGQMRLFAPDIFGMQEVQPNQKQHVITDLPDYAIVGGGRDDGVTKGEASPLGIKKDKWAIVSHGQFWLSPTPDKPGKAWDADYPRIATWAHVKARKGSKRLLVINTHFDHVGKEARLESARQLTRWIADNRKPQEFVVLMGDFNTSADSPPLTKLKTDGALKDSRDVSETPPFGPPGSFTGFDYAKREAKAIDHILVGPNINVTQYAIVEQTVSGRLPSDHYPVVADLVLGRCQPNKR